MRPLPWFLPLLLAGCASVPRVAAPPPARQSPVPLLEPPPPPVADWRDAPLTAGNWRYARTPSGSTARFVGTDGAAAFEIACDLAAHRVSLVAAGSGPLRIVTSSGARTLPAAIDAAGRASAAFAARDPFLDQLAFSRARFAVEVPGSARLVLPAWAEPARVVEDCRA